MFDIMYFFFNLILSLLISDYMFTIQDSYVAINIESEVHVYKINLQIYNINV